MSNTNIEIKSEDEVVAIEPNGGVGVWNESIESYLICLIEDEVKKGNRPTTTLTKPAWKFVRQKLKEKTNKDYSQDQLKNKYNQLRAKWKEFSKILEETGIGYNAVTHQLSTKDAIWKKLCESAKTFKNKGCKHYDKLCTIFGDTTATGASSHPSTKSPSNSEDGDDTDGEVGSLEKEGEEGPKAKKSKPNVNPKKLKEKVNIAMANALVWLMH
ncbi:L10-interacting MYB domain-containing protein [Bienertia sinuspersici]